LRGIDVHEHSPSLRVLSFLYWILRGLGKRTARGSAPRAFSNRVLRNYLQFLGGDIINVSGWQDSDKEGDFYRNYYGESLRYVVSNIHGEGGMPAEPSPDVESIYLDLDEPLPQELEGAFDVVFSHTVLEHVFDTQLALQNLDRLSRDTVITVVPFSETVHYTHSYGDYVRLSPLFLKRFFEERGYSVLLSVSNEQPFFPVYLVFIASRYPERHEPHFRSAPRCYEVQLTPVRWGRYGAATGLTPMRESE
jgi:SAM-dependent methyltransferase